MLKDLVTARRIVRVRPQARGLAYKLVREARRARVPVSLACALVEQESNFSNVFGHDPTVFVGAGKVTKAKYLTYKRLRGHTLMQGVGPCQLTWWATQDRADELGGCWRPAINMRVGFAALKQNISWRGLRAGVAAYNGSGTAAQRYAVSVLDRQKRWHDYFIRERATP